MSGLQNVVLVFISCLVFPAHSSQNWLIVFYALSLENMNNNIYKQQKKKYKG